ncbi:MAG: hypothetical protein COA63_010805 [Methylophaga sp.]|nr:hypothetical protein [Methylophaga sp.]
MNESIIISDELLEHWGMIFVDNNIVQHHITFEQFLMDPEEILHAHAFSKPMPLVDDFYSLLDKQVAVQQKVDQIDDIEQMQQDMDEEYERQGHIIELHGNRHFEPIHKRSFPKRYKTGMKRKLQRAS